MEDIFLGEAIRNIWEKWFHRWLLLKISKFAENSIVTTTYNDGEALA